MYKSPSSTFELEYDFPPVRSSQSKCEIKKILCFLNCFKKNEKKNKKYFI